MICPKRSPMFTSGREGDKSVPPSHQHGSTGESRALLKPLDCLHHKMHRVSGTDTASGQLSLPTASRSSPMAGGQGHRTVPLLSLGCQHICLCSFQLSAACSSSPAVIYSLEDAVSNSWSHLVPPRHCCTSTGRNRVHADVIFAPLCQGTQR